MNEHFVVGKLYRNTQVEGAIYMYTGFHIGKIEDDENHEKYSDFDFIVLRGSFNAPKNYVGHKVINNMDFYKGSMYKCMVEIENNIELVF